MATDQPSAGVIVDESGVAHVAGEPPVGTIAGTQTPEGDSTDEVAADHATDPDALAKLNATVEPEQFQTIRPDLGTE